MSRCMGNNIVFSNFIRNDNNFGAGRSRVDFHFFHLRLKYQNAITLAKKYFNSVILSWYAAAGIPVTDS